MKKRTLIVLLLSVAATAVMALIKVKSNVVPEKELTIARKMLAEAELVKSPRYAQALYSKALHDYDAAMAEWRKENERFILFRDYQMVVQLAEQSTQSSIAAIDQAGKNISKVEDQLDIQINILGSRIKVFDENLGRFPINRAHQSEITKSKLKYSEGVLAYKNKNFSLCKSKLDSVENTINRVFSIYEEMLTVYLDAHTKWKEMEAQTIYYSKRNKLYVLVIDKLARECTLYKDGNAVHNFSVELGANWVGDKMQQGDKSTPEGFYKIIGKKANQQTRFYKALLLDYPNEEDQKRFVKNRKNGLVKPNAKIGNLIEIHGDGGKGADWTDGCIALKDAEMDVLFRLCSVDTRVTIVGSTKSLNEISKNRDDSSEIP